MLGKTEPRARRHENNSPLYTQFATQLEDFLLDYLIDHLEMEFFWRVIARLAKVSCTPVFIANFFSSTNTVGFYLRSDDSIADKTGMLTFLGLPEDTKATLQSPYILNQPLLLERLYKSFIAEMIKLATSEKEEDTLFLQTYQKKSRYNLELKVLKKIFTEARGLFTSNQADKFPEGLVFIINFLLSMEEKGNIFLDMDNTMRQYLNNHQQLLSIGEILSHYPEQVPGLNKLFAVLSKIDHSNDVRKLHDFENQTLIPLKTTHQIDFYQSRAFGDFILEGLGSGQQFTSKTRKTGLMQIAVFFQGMISTETNLAALEEIDPSVLCLPVGSHKKAAADNKDGAKIVILGSTVIDILYPQFLTWLETLKKEKPQQYASYQINNPSLNQNSFLNPERMEVETASNFDNKMELT